MGSLITKIKRKVVRDYRPKKLATESRRLDLVAAQIADILHLMGERNNFPLRGKKCLEIGSGWVLSHSLLFWILGAEKVVATDIQHVAKPYVLKKSLKASIDSIIRDILAPFEDHSVLRERINKLKSFNTYDFEILGNLGIEYQAPVNLAKVKPEGQFDFIFSNSVMEHVPVDDVLLLLRNLSENLNSGGKMIHRIHMEDHRNIGDDPFAFFSEDEKDYSRNIQTKRGNRIRRDKWKSIFDSIEDTSSSILFEFTRKDKPLPYHIDQSVTYTDEQDLRCSNIGMLTIKN